MDMATDGETRTYAPQSTSEGLAACGAAVGPLIEVSTRWRVSDDNVGVEGDGVVPEGREVRVGGWRLRRVVGEGPETAVRGVGGAKDAEACPGAGGRGEADVCRGVVQVGNKGG